MISEKNDINHNCLLGNRKYGGKITFTRMAQLASKAKEIIMLCQVRSSVENSKTLIIDTEK